MATTTAPYSEDRALYQKAIDQLVSFIKGESFLSYARKIHQAVGWEKLANRLESANSRLSDKSENIFEWYLECQQINAEILTNLASAIASETVELATHVPVIRELSYLIDKVIVAALNIGNKLIKMINSPSYKNSDAVVKHTIDTEDAYGLHDWYNKHIASSVQEIRDIIDSVYQKHDHEDEKDHPLSSLAASVQIAAVLLKMQSRIITGLLSVPAKQLGHLTNDVIEKLELSELVRGMGKLIRELFEMIFQLPTTAEAKLLNFIDETGDKMTQVEQLGADDSHRPHM
jgi:hypothetical protein